MTKKKDNNNNNNKIMPSQLYMNNYKTYYYA